MHIDNNVKIDYNPITESYILKINQVGNNDPKLIPIKTDIVTSDNHILYSDYGDIVDAINATSEDKPYVLIDVAGTYYVDFSTAVFTNLYGIYADTGLTVNIINRVLDYTPSDANTIYVSKDGDDSTGDGSEANPVLTITHAITLCDATHQTIMILDSGTYEEIAFRFTGNFKNLYSAIDSNPLIKLSRSDLDFNIQSSISTLFSITSTYGHGHFCELPDGNLLITYKVTVNASTDNRLYYRIYTKAGVTVKSETLLEQTSTSKLYVCVPVVIDSDTVALVTSYSPQVISPSGSVFYIKHLTLGTYEVSDAVNILSQLGQGLSNPQPANYIEANPGYFISGGYLYINVYVWNNNAASYYKSEIHKLNMTANYVSEAYYRYNGATTNFNDTRMFLYDGSIHVINTDYSTSKQYLNIHNLSTLAQESSTEITSVIDDVFGGSHVFNSNTFGKLNFNMLEDGSYIVSCMGYKAAAPNYGIFLGHFDSSFTAVLTSIQLTDMQNAQPSAYYNHTLIADGNIYGLNLNTYGSVCNLTTVNLFATYITSDVDTKIDGVSMTIGDYNYVDYFIKTSGNPSVGINNCTIYGIKGYHLPHVLFSDGATTISNSIIRDNDKGLWIENNVVDVSYSQFFRNNNGYCLTITGAGSGIVIDHCDIIFSNGGIRLVSNDGDEVLKNSIFYNVPSYSIEPDTEIDLLNSVVTSTFLNTILISCSRSNPLYKNEGSLNPNDIDLELKTRLEGYLVTSPAYQLADDTYNAGSYLVQYLASSYTFSSITIEKPLKIDRWIDPSNVIKTVRRDGSIGTSFEGLTEYMEFTYEGVLLEEYRKIISLYAADNLTVRIYLEPVANPNTYEVWKMIPQRLNRSAKHRKLTRTGYQDIKILFGHAYTVEDYNE